MERGPSLEANDHSASQENSWRSMEPVSSLPSSQKAATDPCPELKSSSSQLPSTFPYNQFNITLPSTPTSFEWSVSLRLRMHFSSVPYVLHAPPTNPYRFDHPSNNIFWSVKVLKLLIMQSSPVSCHFLPLRSKFCPQCPVLKHPESMSLSQYERPSFIPIQNSR